MVGSESGRVCAVRCLGGRLIATRLVKAEDSPAGTSACHARPVHLLCIYRPASPPGNRDSPFSNHCLHCSLAYLLPTVQHSYPAPCLAPYSSTRHSRMQLFSTRGATYLLPQQPITHQHITSRQIVSNRQSHARLFILHFKQRHVSLMISLQYSSDNT